MIPLFKVFVSEEAKALVNKTLNSGFLGEGPRVAEFEDLMSSWLETDRVLAVNSASSGLEMAVELACNQAKGCKFLTTALTCTATNWPIVHNNQFPVWVDIDPKTLNMDLEDLKKKLKWTTTGIMVTHWAGRAHHMEALLQIQKDFEEEHGRPLYIIEDCAHAFCGFYRDQALGTFGNFGVYSFQAVKQLTTGDGGCLISRSQADHDRAKLMRWYGIDRNNRDADIEEAGYKYHMNDIAASMGISNILPAHDNVRKNISNAKYYNEALKDVEDIVLLEEAPAHITHPYWLYTILLERREDFIRAMKGNGIEVGIGHKRNDKYKCVEIHDDQFLPNLDSIQNNYVNIPVGWWVTPEDREHIVESIKKGW